MLTASTKQVRDNGEDLIDDLDDGRADGMIVLGQSSPLDVKNSLNNVPSSKPILLACERVDDERVSSVRVENRRGTRTALQYLHVLGHHKFARFKGPEDNILMKAQGCLLPPRCRRFDYVWSPIGSCLAIFHGR